MLVALFHNRYQYAGGEDSVVDTEIELLRRAGHEVRTFIVSNRDHVHPSLVGRLGVGLRAVRNPRMKSEVAAFLREKAVDVGHVHNFFPVLSPSVYEALREAGVPVVQTLHNFRLLCANGTLVRDGRVCEECLGQSPWHALLYGCYRDSRLQTAAWARMVAHHRRHGTWNTMVDTFITPSAFARDQLIDGGLPADRLVVKPNPVADPGSPQYGGCGAVYVGRLFPEKGVRILLEAWRQIDAYPLTIVGSGPQEPELRALAASMPHVQFTGQLSADQARQKIRQSLFVVAPSIAYETFGMAVAEAMANGKAVVAAEPGALPELVESGRTGLLFTSGNAAGCAAACRKLVASPETAVEMGRRARARYEESMRPAENLKQLETIYERAIRSRDAARVDG